MSEDEVCQGLHEAIETLERAMCDAGFIARAGVSMGDGRYLVWGKSGREWHLLLGQQSIDGASITLSSASLKDRQQASDWLGDLLHACVSARDQLQRDLVSATYVYLRAAEKLRNYPRPAPGARTDLVVQAVEQLPLIKQPAAPEILILLNDVLATSKLGP